MAIIRAGDSIDQGADYVDVFVHELSPRTQRTLYRFVFGQHYRQDDAPVDRFICLDLQWRSP
ncbi:hypothetical protein ACHAXT_007506 [Thalassiosira profunda]